MNRPLKITLGIITAVAIFAVGVQYSDNVIAFVNDMKRKFGKYSEKELKEIKNKISDDLILKNQMPGVFAISTRFVNNDPKGPAYITITVKDENTKGEIIKYLKKNKLENAPVQIEIGEMTKAL